MKRFNLQAFWACFWPSLAMSMVTTKLLTACAGTPQPPADLPPELPHYPCQRQQAGKTVYYACSDMEWVEQQNPKKERP